MPPDYYFRGTLARYWIWIYAEYQRLFSVYGREPFEFTSPDPKTSPLAEYAPKYYDFVEILFWEAEHRDFIVRVKANSALDSDLVNLYVSIYVTPLKKYGESNLFMWEVVKNSLEEQGLLIHPTAQLMARPQKPSKPKRGSSIIIWFDWYHNMLEAGHKCTLQEIAKETSHNESYIRRLHANYVRERRMA